MQPQHLQSMLSMLETQGRVHDQPEGNLLTGLSLHEEASLKAFN